MMTRGKAICARISARSSGANVNELASNATGLAGRGGDELLQAVNRHGVCLALDQEQDGAVKWVDA